MPVYKWVNPEYLEYEHPEILIRCDCGAGETLLITDLWDGNPADIRANGDNLSVTITYWPQNWRKKLRAIWRILRGVRYVGYVEEVLLTSSDARALVDWLEGRLQAREEALDAEERDA